jgi:hypothetical protein
MMSLVVSVAVAMLLTGSTGGATVGQRDAKPSPQTDDIAIFLAQLRVATGLDEQVSTRLAAAAASARRDPAAYLRSHPDDFLQRGIEETRSDLYIFVLLDGLCEARAAAWLDWKTEWEDVLWSIDTISHERGFTTGRWDARSIDTETALAVVATQLRARGKRLLQWRMDEDAYYVLVVDPSAAAGLIRAAKRVGVDIAHVVPR